MNSKGHLYLSIIKSILRYLACILAWAYNSLPIMAVGFMCAESLGILEELVDNR